MSSDYIILNAHAYAQITKYLSKKLINFQKKTKNILLSCVIVCLCSGYIDPADLIFKNINLLPDPIDHTDRSPNLTKDMHGKKSEQIIKTKKIPTINAEPIEVKVKIKPKLKDLFNIYNDLLKSNANLIKAKNIKTMFNLDKLDPEGKIFSFNADISSKASSSLKSQTDKIPILNDLPKFPLYNGKTWIVKTISDIKVNDLDKILPTSVADPLKPGDYQIDPLLDIFPASVTPDSVLNTNVLDILP